MVEYSKGLAIYPWIKSPKYSKINQGFKQTNKPISTNTTRCGTARCSTRYNGTRGISTSSITITRNDNSISVNTPIFWGKIQLLIQCHSRLEMPQGTRSSRSRPFFRSPFPGGQNLPHCPLYDPCRYSTRTRKSNFLYFVLFCLKLIQ